MISHSFIKKMVTAVVGVTLILPLVLIPQAAKAFVVYDPVNAAINTHNGAQLTEANVKTHILDGIAWTVAKIAIQSITRSIVNWINSGFNGSPAFVTDLKSHLLGVGDGITRSFVLQLTVNAKISSPFLNSVIKGVAGAYFFATNKDAIVNRLKYNLSQRVQNDRAFLSGQFSQGGFNGWFAASQMPQNNPYGAQFLAQEELNNRIDSQIDQRLTELGWGKGFLSWRKCTAYASGGTTALSNADTCTNESIQTPGSVIESQLENSLGSGIRQLELADSFNEIVSALMGQLVNQVLGSTGLSGTTQATSRDTTSYLNQATSDTAASSSLQQSFVTTLTSFSAQVTTFQQNWTTIQNAAQGAKTALEACDTQNATSLLASDVTPVLTEAGEHLTTATNALASTSALKTQATATLSSNTDAAAFFMDLSNQYDVLVGTISSEDFARAASESVDSSDPLTLYTHMNQIRSQAALPRGCVTVQ